MVKLNTPSASIGWEAEDFLLLATDNRKYSLDNIRGSNGTVVMFICNHCPFVKEIIKSIVFDMKSLAKHGVTSMAIMSNDTEAYPEDSFLNMKKFAENNDFTFPYAIDNMQEVAKAYGAVCTPDFFGFDKDLKLQYRGCLINKATGNHDLLDAMIDVSKASKTSIKQIPSIGCSIKWIV